MSGIYSLVSIEKDCHEDQYIQAISYDKSCLQTMMDNLDSKTLNLANFVIKENGAVSKIRKILVKIINKPIQILAREFKISTYMATFLLTFLTMAVVVLFFSF